MLTVIYFHGFNSSPKNKKVDMLRAAGFNVVAPNIDIDPDIAEPDLIGFLSVQFRKYKDSKCVILGTSLGGFWTARMGMYFDCTSVVINPSLHPDISLMKYLGENENYSTGEVSVLTEEIVKKYELYDIVDDSYVTYFIANKDTDVPDTKSKVFEFDSDDHQGMTFFPEVIAYLKHIEYRKDIDPTEYQKM